jgi:hypothetical protein
MRAGPDEARQDFVGLGNLLLDDPVHVWKYGEQSPQHVLQSGQSGPLSWKGRLLDDIVGNVIIGGVEPPTVQNFLNETGVACSSRRPWFFLPTRLFALLGSGD